MSKSYRYDVNNEYGKKKDWKKERKAKNKMRRGEGKRFKILNEYKLICQGKSELSSKDKGRVISNICCDFFYQTIQ